MIPAKASASILPENDGPRPRHSRTEADRRFPIASARFGIVGVRRRPATALAVAARRKCRISSHLSRERLIFPTLYSGAEPSPAFANSALRKRLAPDARTVSFAPLASRRLGARPLPAPRSHAHIHAASGFRAQSRCRLAEIKAGQERHTADLPSVWLRGHRQDHPGTAYRRRRRWRCEICGIHWKGRAGDAQQGLRQRLHDPLADLPCARIRRRAAELRAVG